MEFQFDYSVFALIVLAVIVLIQQWVIVRLGKGLETSFPAAIAAFIPTIIQVARDQAAKTESKVDDQVVDLLAGVIPLVQPKSDPDELQAAG